MVGGRSSSRWWVAGAAAGGGWQEQQQVVRGVRYLNMEAKAVSFFLFSMWLLRPSSEMCFACERLLLRCARWQQQGQGKNVIAGRRATGRDSGEEGSRT